MSRHPRKCARHPGAAAAVGMGAGTGAGTQARRSSDGERVGSANARASFGARRKLARSPRKLPDHDLSPPPPPPGDAARRKSNAKKALSPRACFSPWARARERRGGLEWSGTRGAPESNEDATDSRSVVRQALGRGMNGDSCAGLGGSNESEESSPRVSPAYVSPLEPPEESELLERPWRRGGRGRAEWAGMVWYREERRGRDGELSQRESQPGGAG
jgi:hypothetical protein